MAKRIRFEDYIENLLGKQEANRLLEAIKGYAPRAVRYNPAINPKGDLPGEPVPWHPSFGRYWHDEINPSQTMQYLTGDYYIQEASAMLLVSALSRAIDSDGLRIIDLTAAPGGKATQIAELSQNNLVVANEVIRGRADALLWNVIRHRLTNTIVCNLPLKSLADELAGWFDVVIVDAPCSGEGLFQKKKHNPNAWSHKNVLFNSSRQRAILQDAMRVLKPDGILAYSTCTFGREENEDQIAFLLDNGFSPIEFPDLQGVSPAITDDEKVASCSRRLFPHRQKAAGAFAALLRKTRHEEEQRVRMTAHNDKKLRSHLSDSIDLPESMHLYRIGDSIHAIRQHELPKILHDNAIQIGSAIFSIKPLPEPLHGSILFPSASHIVPLTDEQTRNYRQGSNLTIDRPDGYYYVESDDVVLGIVKISAGRAVNRLPKPLR